MEVEENTSAGSDRANDFDREQTAGRDEILADSEQARDISELVEGFPSEEEASSKASPSELAELQDKHLRLLAEFENYRKRVTKERGDLLRYQGESIFQDLLEVADNFDRALSFADSNEEQLRQGLELIDKVLKDILKKWDVRGESAIGKQFDPRLHSALSQVPTPNAAPGTVLNELKKCYFYKDKLIRPAEVVVSMAPDSTEES